MGRPKGGPEMLYGTSEDDVVVVSEQLGVGDRQYFGEFARTMLNTKEGQNNEGDEQPYSV